MAYITSWYWNKGDFRKVNEDSFTLQRVRARKRSSYLLRFATESADCGQENARAVWLQSS